MVTFVFYLFLILSIYQTKKMKPTNSLVSDEAAQENPMNRYSLLAPMFAEAPGLTFICKCLSRLKMFQFVLGHSYSYSPPHSP